MVLAYAAIDTLQPPIDPDLMYDVILPVLCDHGNVDETEAITRLNARSGSVPPRWSPPPD